MKSVYSTINWNSLSVVQRRNSSNWLSKFVTVFNWAPHQEAIWEEWSYSSINSWLHNLEQGFPNFFPGRTPKLIFHISEEPISMETKTKQKRQSVTHADYSTTANCHTKIPVIFRLIFEIFRSISKFLYMYSTNSLGTLTMFSATLVGKHWSTQSWQALQAGRSTAEEKSPVPTAQETGWVPEPVWTVWTKEKYLATTGYQNRFLSRPG